MTYPSSSSSSAPPPPQFDPPDLTQHPLSGFTDEQLERLRQLIEGLESSSLLESKVAVVLALRDFERDLAEYCWELILEWLLSKHRWSEALYVLREYVQRMDRYSEQPPYTLYFAVIYEQFGIQDLALRYLRSSIADMMYRPQYEFEMLKRLCPGDVGDLDWWRERGVDVGD
ncbi:MAG: hypothetical protein AAF725_15960 [Acidobacteriota bacterium]